jgi:hypothetical protein
MNHLNSNLAREAGRLADWREKFWGRRYEAIVISEEEAAQVERLKYVLSHGCKEGLVERPADWPGVHAARALAEGLPVEGYWFDRTREYAARLRGEDFDRLRYASRETIFLDPLPCWKHLSPERLHKRISDLLAQIETEARAVRERTGRTTPGRRAILSQHPHVRPNRPKESPAPLFHAATKRARRALYEAYRLFVRAFREASERLRAGDRDVIFPSGSFPPALPFVGG